MYNFMYDCFENLEQAEQAFNLAIISGYEPNDITIIFARDFQGKISKICRNASILEKKLSLTFEDIIAETNVLVLKDKLEIARPLISCGGVTWDLITQLLYCSSSQVDSSNLMEENPSPIFVRISKGAIMLILKLKSAHFSLIEQWSCIKNNQNHKKQ